MGAPGLANGGTRHRRREDRGAEGVGYGEGVFLSPLGDGQKFSILDLK